jgi:predicted RNase H-like nuclease
MREVDSRASNVMPDAEHPLRRTSIAQSASSPPLHSAESRQPIAVRFRDARSVRIAKRLVDAGWQHPPELADDREWHGRRLFEVYPHPAHVVLFDLCRIIKYKKGKMAQKRAGLEEFRGALAHNLGTATPRLIMCALLEEIVNRPLQALHAKALKRYEDTLDAVLCAFIAAHYWSWGAERNDLIGTLDDGYIVVPSRTVDGRPWSFERRIASGAAVDMRIVN